ncbi:MAG TPA: hypothetical protein VLT33_39995, partial [Labilithrix sp.]|nr:hypothetical protein [Labilithrix sp.]
MKTRLLSLVLSATAFLACSSSPATNDASSGGTATGVGGGTDPGVTPDDDGGGASSSGGGSSSGGPVAGAELKIGTASFRNVGRLGDAMRIQLTGTDPAAATSAAHLRFTDASDAPVNAVDTNWDGIVDSPEATYHFETSALGKASFDGAITIPSLFIPSSNVKKVFVSLENEAGARSAETAVALTAQTVAHADEACDADKITSRCEAGLSCGGTPATCQAATAPTWSKVAYFGGAFPKMAFRGEEADEDIGSISVEFLDNGGNAKEVVLTGEIGDPNATTGSSVTIDARASGLGTTFFLETQPTTGFVSQVPKIAATAMDR